MEARQDNSEQRHSKKRKTEDENDDEKVEEFFALLRSTREARDRLRSKDRTEREQKDRHDKVNDVVDIAGRRREKIHGVWSPTFRPEDFLDHRDDGEKKFLAGTSQTSTKETQEENVGHVAGNNSTCDHKGSLDLNLSL